jgi:hypothetical protein
MIVSYSRCVPSAVRTPVASTSAIASVMTAVVGCASAGR